MKASRDALFSYVLGIILYFAVFVYSVVVEMRLEIMLIGISSLCLLWTIGIMRDVYGKEDVKVAKEEA